MSLMHLSSNDRSSSQSARLAWAGAVSLLMIVGGHFCHAETQPLSAKIANGIVQHPAVANDAASASSALSREASLTLQGLDAEWYNTANGTYFEFVKSAVDAALHNQQNSKTGSEDAAADGLFGQQLLMLYRVTIASRYYEAARSLRQRLAGSCGIDADKLSSAQAIGAGQPTCMAEAFLAEYASVFHAPQDLDAITADFEQLHSSIGSEHLNGETSDRGDEALLAFNLIESLEFFPRNGSHRERLLQMLNAIAAAVEQHQDSASGMLYEEGGSPAATRRPVPARAACLYVYVLFRGVREGVLPEKYSRVAERAWHAITNGSVPPDAGIHRGSEDARAAGDKASARDESSDGRGELLLAATEAELAPTAALARGKTVLLDAWYNSQQRKDIAGQMESFHYKWTDFSDSGFSLLGHLFRSYGASTDTLSAAPTAVKLSKAQYYVIVSPDIPVKNPNPHYMNERDAAEIAEWVKQGGVLILMENDPPNADIVHLNLLADRFGIHFDDVLVHHILGEQVADGRIPVAAGGPVFHHAHTLYMKDTCAITLHGAGTVLLRDRGNVVLASARYGKGTVFAAVDPWLYNEYTDGRKKPEIYSQFDNFAAGRELVRWLLEQHHTLSLDQTTRKEK